jgi:hypothetical protein
VRERYFCFSADGWNGSIRGSLLRMGGNVGFFDFDSGSLSEFDLARPGCCRLISCFRSNSTWNSSSASVSFFASGSREPYVSCHVCVRCLSSVGGDSVLLAEFGDGGCGRRELGAGDVLVDEGPALTVLPIGEGCGGLPLVDGAGDRS